MPRRGALVTGSVQSPGGGDGGLSRAGVIVLLGDRVLQGGSWDEVRCGTTDLIGLEGGCDLQDATDRAGDARHSLGGEGGKRGLGGKMWMLGTGGADFTLSF